MRIYPLLRDGEGAAFPELENIALYDRFLAQPLPDDVRETFEYNRQASLERHLRAFRRCVERG